MTKQQEGADLEKEMGEEGDWDQESSGGELFKFETVGTSLTGLLVAKKRSKTQLGDANFYTLLCKGGEHTFVPTKALEQDIEKYIRQYGVGNVILDITLMDLKKGAYASPFKVFRTRAAKVTEARLAQYGIPSFDNESTTEEGDEA